MTSTDLLFRGVHGGFSLTPSRSAKPVCLGQPFILQGNPTGVVSPPESSLSHHSVITQSCFRFASFKKKKKIKQILFCLRRQGELKPPSPVATQCCMVWLEHSRMGCLALSWPRLGLLPTWGWGWRGQVWRRSPSGTGAAAREVCAPHFSTLCGALRRVPGVQFAVTAYWLPTVPRGQSVTSWPYPLCFKPHWPCALSCRFSEAGRESTGMSWEARGAGSEGPAPLSRGLGNKGLPCCPRASAWEGSVGTKENRKRMV